MFVNKVGLPVQGRNENANFSTMCDRPTQACHRRSVELCEPFRGVFSIVEIFMCVFLI